MISQNFRLFLECDDECVEDLMISNEVNLVNHNSGWKGLKSLTDRVFHACVASWAIGVDRHLLTMMREEMMITPPYNFFRLTGDPTPVIRSPPLY